MRDMKDRVLTLLKQEDGFISGEKLSNVLGVSRTAIWKTMTKLKEEGYEIQSVTRKGYKLVHSPDVLTEEEIKYNLNTKFIGGEMKYMEEVDSTNLQVKKKVLDGAADGFVLVADRQLKGRGRRGRDWLSPTGTGIWTSILLKPDINPNSASMLTLVAGVAVCEAIREVSGTEAYIKWPNDIVINKKKVCGILTEMSGELDHINYIVLGIGINVNMDEFPEELSNATSIKIEAKKDISRVNLLRKVLQDLEYYYDAFMEQGDLSSFINTYKKYCITYDSYVKVFEGKTEIRGKVTDITPTGELILKDETGKEVTIRSGEVSVRGLYGYV